MAVEGIPNEIDISKELIEESKRLNALASEVTRRVEWFEDWLNKLPGKVDAEFIETVPSSPTGKRLYGISFNRDGKRWSLDFGSKPVDPNGAAGDWTTLSTAGLDMKCRAITLFKPLLLAMLKKQREQTAKYSKACQEFDSFVQSLPLLATKEGK